jgi:hypothetical protein
MNKTIIKPKRAVRKASRARTVKGRGGLKNLSARVPELRVLSGRSIEELVEQVDGAVRQGFARRGAAWFEREDSRPFRQAMVRYEDAPAPPRKISVRKLGR